MGRVRVRGADSVRAGLEEWRRLNEAIQKREYFRLDGVEA